MQVTEVTASWSETATLGNYSNVKPSLTLKATIGPGEDPQIAILALTEACKRHVQEQVDLALEQEGQPAKYSLEPRFDVLSARWQVSQEQQTKILIIVPQHTPNIIAGEGFYRHARRDRYAAALRKVESDRVDDPSGQVRTLVFDCSDGYLDRAVAAIQIAQQAQEAYFAERERRQEEERAERKRQAARAQIAPAGEPDLDYDDDDDDEYEEG